MFNLADYLQSLGYSQTTAAMMASIFDFAGIFGSVVRRCRLECPLRCIARKLGEQEILCHSFPAVV